jgi:hypothetical protein
MKTSNIFFWRGASSEPLRVHAGHDAAAARPDLALIDFQWTGAAPSGAGDVAYLLAGGVQFEVLAASESALLGTYYAALSQRLRARGFTGTPAAGAARGGGSGSGGGGCAYTRDAFQADYDLELLDYAATALPYLLNGLTPAAAATNRGKHGWLTHEYDARVTAWLCARAVQTVERLME